MLYNVGTWQNQRLAGRIVELDGIRGLAILLVLIWHYVVNSVENIAHGSWQAYVLFPLRITWSGVDLFFVLSGFLIGGILYDAKDAKGYYRTFYCRRMYRIFPVYFAWTAIFFIGLFLTRDDYAGSLRRIFNADLPLWSYPVFAQNIAMAWDQTFGPKWMGMTWSLAVEEQFYLLLPFLVRNLNRRGIFLLALSMILFAPIVRSGLWFYGNEFFGPYVLLPSRADAFGFGILVALACRTKHIWLWFRAHRILIHVCLAILAGGLPILLKHEQVLYTLGLTWIAAFYASLLVLIVSNFGGVETICFRSRVLVQLGTLAYGIYILHDGLLALLRVAIFDGRDNVGNLSSLSVSAFSLIIVLVLATISWRYMERPLIRRAHATYRYAEQPRDD
jgi:peptidoglycan/LPS O-acetylase OafA/YrhL